MTASTANTTAGHGRAANAPAEAVRACAATGAHCEQVEIVRRARRGDDALLLLVHADGSWWVARRVSGTTKVVAYIGDREAESGFEFFLASPSPRGEWRERQVATRAA